MLYQSLFRVSQLLETKFALADGQSDSRWQAHYKDQLAIEHYCSAIPYGSLYEVLLPSPLAE
jgi:hypothetical protein